MKPYVNGFVFGFLDAEGRVDQKKCLRILDTSNSDKDFTFHRAIDMVANPVEAVEILVELQFKRILTSGQEKTAWQGD